MIKIYHNPRCRKSREGLEIIEKSKKEFEIIKYLENVPSKKELTEIIKFLDISPIELVRKNEKIWKENFKGKEFTNDEMISIMVQYPKLIERPIVIKESKAIIGRPASLILEFI